METHILREKYLNFFKERGHTVIPSATLVPENDPTTLFTGSGMQPLVPYLLGKDHPAGARLSDSQKCFRAQDIEEVGDNRHTTFFEMLGNWSFGDYFKEDQLGWFFKFLTDEVGLAPEKLYVTAFSGDEKNRLPQDKESVEIWKKLFSAQGVEAPDIFMGSEKEAGEKGMRGGRIFYYDGSKNWWSRAGKPENMPAGEPGGPDSEVFYDFGTPHDVKFGKECHPNCDCGRFLEIGNSVFMQYQKNANGTFSELPKKNVDFGGGLERITAASINSPDVFMIDAFGKARIVLENAREIRYETEDGPIKYCIRVILDHLRASVFLIGDGVVPSNKDQGYFVRRLIRRTVRYAKKLGISGEYMEKVADAFIMTYVDAYPILSEKRAFIISTLLAEEKKFAAGLEKGMREFEKLSSKGSLSGEDAFILFTTYGFPLELTEELVIEKGGTLDRVAFEAEFTKHRDLSRTASAGKFKGGLADSSEKTTMLHTATHLLLAGLRKYLGPDVHQAGSNITEERTRFDFTYPKKVEPEILRKVEAYVNEAIEKKCSVGIEVMDKEKAKAAGVEGSFWEKYPEKVNVYQVKAEDGSLYSQELCGGPHVTNTGTITGIFKITKEEASSAGVRRVKAILE